MSATVPTCGARRPGWDTGPAIGVHRIPCALPAGHDGEHRDGLGHAWPAEPTASAPRTVTVRTLDHGPVTMPEPPWCVGHPDSAPAQYLADVAHEGPETALAFRGCRMLAASLSASPYSEVYGPDVSACVEVDGDWVRLDPAALDELAAALVARAAELRHLARQLTALRAGGAR